MYGSQYLTEENNTLHIDGVAATDLAAQYGTPLYVMAERELTDRLATVREHFLDKYPNTYASFASKALTVSAVYEQVVRHGLGIDVVTGGELFIARQSGVPAERIYFHGSNKSTADLQYAVEEGVGRIVIDHFAEIAQLESIAAQADQTVHVLIRIVPQVIGGSACENSDRWCRYEIRFLDACVRLLGRNRSDFSIGTSVVTRHPLSCRFANPRSVTVRTDGSDDDGLRRNDSCASWLHSQRS